jgi:hypothetical protein
MQSVEIRCKIAYPDIRLASKNNALTFSVPDIRRTGTLIRCFHCSLRIP